MNRKIIPSLPRFPVSLAPMLPEFGTPLLLVEAVHGVQRSKTIQLVPETQHGQRTLVNINSELCKGCELCIYACPTGNLSLSPQLNRKGYHPVLFSFHGTRGPCSACGLCYWVCPDFAIAEVKKLRQ